MLVKLIHNNKIGAYALMLLLILLVWIKPIMLEQAIDTSSFENPMPLWALFAFISNAPWLGYIFSILSAIVVSLSINRLNSKYALISKQSALPGVIFVLLIAGMPLSLRFNPIWIATLFFILGLEFIFAAHNYRKVMKECFLTAFWISVASLFSYNLVLLYPLFIMLMIPLRLLNLKSFLASLIGFVLPWLFLLGTELIWGSIPDFFQYMSFSWTKVAQAFQHSTFGWIYMISIAFLFFIGALSVASAYGTKKIFTRKQYLVFIFAGLYMVAFMLATGLNANLISLLAVPFSIVIAHFIDHIRSVLWKNIALACMFLISISAHIWM